MIKLVNIIKEIDEESAVLLTESTGIKKFLTKIILLGVIITSSVHSLGIEIPEIKKWEQLTDQEKQQVSLTIIKKNPKADESTIKEFYYAEQTVKQAEIVNAGLSNSLGNITTKLQNIKTSDDLVAKKLSDKITKIVSDKKNDGLPQATDIIKKMDGEVSKLDKLIELGKKYGINVTNSASSK